MNQFEKRKAKAEEAIKAKREKTRESVEETVIEQPVEAVTPVVETTLTHIGYDITLNPETNKHQAIVFNYNPITRDVKIIDIVPIQRQVALMYDNQKHALKTLLKR